MDNLDNKTTMSTPINTKKYTCPDCGKIVNSGGHKCTK